MKILYIVGMYLDEYWYVDEYISMGPRGRFHSYKCFVGPSGRFTHGYVILNCLGQVLYFGRAPRTKETFPDFRERCRVTRHSRVFSRVDG